MRQSSCPSGFVKYCRSNPQMSNIALARSYQVTPPTIAAWKVRYGVKSQNKPKFAPGATITPGRPLSRPTENVTAEEKAAPVLDGKMALVDREAELAGIDRGTREGFKRYMEERPEYFRWVFPGVTIAEAWGMVGGR